MVFGCRDEEHAKRLYAELCLCEWVDYSHMGVNDDSKRST